MLSMYNTDRTNIQLNGKVIKYVVIGMLLILGACAERKNDPVQPTEVNLRAATEAIYTQHIAATAQAFKRAVETFSEQAGSFCALPSENGLQIMQTLWEDAQLAWFALANYNFGPAVQDIVFPVYTFIDSYRLRGTDYTNTVRSDLMQTIFSNDFDATAHSLKPFQFKGLLPLELLLFSNVQEGAVASPEILNEFLQYPNKCNVLLSLNRDFLARAEQIEKGWNTDYLGYQQSYFTLHEEGLLETLFDPLAAVLTAIQQHLDYLHKRNVVNNVAQLSQSSWVAIESSIINIESLLAGNGDIRFTLFEIMEANGYGASVEELKTNLSFARNSLNERDGVNLALALTLLDGNFKRTIPNALNVSLGINFSDGD